MPSKVKSIPADVRKQAEKAVERFNAEQLGGGDIRYEVRFRGRHLYLDRSAYGGGPEPVCRLEYTGKPDEWEFAIFRWSSEKYDPDEWMFPGSGLVDGTIEGAMAAGMEAYPP